MILLQYKQHNFITTEDDELIALEQFLDTRLDISLVVQNFVFNKEDCTFADPSGAIVSLLYISDYLHLEDTDESKL